MLIASQKSHQIPNLQNVILLKPPRSSSYSDVLSYQAMVSDGAKIPIEALARAENLVDIHDVCNLQFTSGTTGTPKAAMLTHQYVKDPQNFAIVPLKLKQQYHQQCEVCRRSHGSRRARCALLSASTLSLFWSGTWTTGHDHAWKLRSVSKRKFRCRRCATCSNARKVHSTTWCTSNVGGRDDAYSRW